MAEPRNGALAPRSTRQRLRLPVAIALVSALAALSGCKKRLPLTPKELARVQTEAGVQPLRVYTERKLISLYPADEKNEQFEVSRDIRETTRQDQLKKIVTKNTAGLILKIEERNGAPLLWVTFEPGCTAVDCAYGFVQTEDGRYRLADVPDRPSFADPTIYRSCVWKKRKLRAGRMKSLQESNDILLVKKNNGKLLTIVLTVKKIVDDRTRTRTDRAKGIE
ncbi:MAG: hypothetical protein JKY37_02645 [Nannocystaceae bacterium]|nr:hypothetical protein [Nannocystaceae bacterium]